MLYLPPGCDAVPRFVCRVPQPDGTPCGETFHSDVSLVRHVRQCAARNEQQIQTGAIRHRVPALDSWDPEIERHMRRVGERMLAEGRMTVRPSERAGFS